MPWEIVNTLECTQCRKTFTWKKYWFDKNVFVPNSEPDIVEGHIEVTKVGPVCPECKTSTLWDMDGIVGNVVHSFPEGLLIVWKEARA